VDSVGGVAGQLRWWCVPSLASEVSRQLRRNRSQLEVPELLASEENWLGQNVRARDERWEKNQARKNRVRGEQNRDASPLLGGLARV